mgnify:CR=1 FL=1
MMKLFKNVMILIGIIISFSIYEFLCHDGTLDFYVILKRSIILAIIGIILLLVIEMIKLHCGIDYLEGKNI